MTETRRESTPLVHRVQTHALDGSVPRSAIRVEEQRLVVAAREQNLCREETVTTSRLRLVTTTRPASDVDAERLAQSRACALLGGLFAAVGFGAAPFVPRERGRDEEGNETASLRDRALILGAVGAFFTLACGPVAFIDSIRLRERIEEGPMREDVTSSRDTPCGPIRPSANAVVALAGRPGAAPLGRTRADGDLVVPLHALPSSVLEQLFRERSLRLEIGDGDGRHELAFTVQPEVVRALEALRATSAIALLDCGWTDDKTESPYAFGNGDGRIDDQESIAVACRLINRGVSPMTSVALALSSDDPRIRLRILASREVPVWPAGQERRFGFQLRLRGYEGSEQLRMNLTVSAPGAVDARLPLELRRSH